MLIYIRATNCFNLFPILYLIRSWLVSVPALVSVYTKQENPEVRRRRLRKISVNRNEESELKYRNEKFIFSDSTVTKNLI